MPSQAPTAVEILRYELAPQIEHLQQQLNDLQLIVSAQTITIASLIRDENA